MEVERTSRRYLKPPVVEALCELFFESSKWDDTVVGRFFELVKERFPRRRQKEVQEAQVMLSVSGEASAGVRRLPPQIQFLNAEGTSLLQVRQDLLVINQLRPYPGFEGWEPKIYWALNRYWELAEPKGVSRIGFRYINRIEVPGSTMRMEDSFRIYPQLPENMGDVHGAFMIRVEVPFQQDGHTVSLTFGTAPPENPACSGYMLDLYDLFQAAQPLRSDQVQAEVRSAHANLEVAFEGSITEQLRTIFQPTD